MKWFGRRRRLIVDHMQLRLLALNMVYSAATVLVFLVIIFGPPIITTFDDSASMEEKLEAANRMLLLHTSTWPALIVLGVLFGFHSIFYTHRIAGPLVGFRRVLGAVGRGDLTVRARVRTKDYLQADSEVINRMIDQLIDRARAVQNAGNDLQSSAVALEELRGVTESRELGRVVRTLEARVGALLAITEGYRLPVIEEPGETVPQSPAVEESDQRELVHS